MTSGDEMVAAAGAMQRQVSGEVDRRCYARYIHLHGPEWDEEAEAILDSIGEIAKAAGLWESPVGGHHPVFYAGTP